MEVFILWEQIPSLCDYDDWIIGVYSSKEKAEEALDDIKNDTSEVEYLITTEEVK